MLKAEIHASEIPLNLSIILHLGESNIIAPTKDNHIIKVLDVSLLFVRLHGPERQTHQNKAIYISTFFFFGKFRIFTFTVKVC